MRELRVVPPFISYTPIDIKRRLTHGYSPRESKLAISQRHVRISGIDIARTGLQVPRIAAAARFGCQASRDDRSGLA